MSQALGVATPTPQSQPHAHTHQWPPPPGSPLITRLPRNSDASSYTRRLIPEEGYKLDIIHPATTSSESGDYVDIIAVHGLTERTDSKNAASTWIFAPPGVSGKADSSIISGITTIAEGGATLFNKAYENVPKPSLYRATPKSTSQLPVGDSAQYDSNTPNVPNTPRSNSSQINDHQVNELPTVKTVNWLKDEGMLPRSFPQARIMQFGYPFSATDGTGDTLEYIATELLARLEKERQDSGSGLSRPIIFIGHSFGGIVISEALILASKTATYSAIATATIGLLFLGTPFKGSDTVVNRLRLISQKKTYGKIGKSLLAQTGQSTPTENQSQAATQPLYNLLDTRINDYKSLQSLVSELEVIVKEKNIHVACFCETIPTERLKPVSKSILMDKDSAALASKYPAIPLQCTHTNLSKFRSSEDPNYILVKREVRKVVDSIPTRRLWEYISTNDTDRVKEILARGANVNETTSKKQNSLHLATVVGNLAIVNLLLAKGVEVNAKDNDNSTPADYALQGSKNSDRYRILEALLEKGAKVEIDEENENKTLGLPGLNLLHEIRYQKGPPTRPNNQDSALHFDTKRLPAGCDTSTCTFTTFYLRTEQEMEKLRKNDGSTSTPAEPITPRVDQGEIEYYFTQHMPISKMLSGPIDQEFKTNEAAHKQWKWYHLPANNMDWVEALFARLQIHNTHGRLFGEEHPSRFAHSFFLKPHTATFTEDTPRRKDTILFMPYLHFETNRGRIYLSNAIKRTTPSSEKHEDSQTKAPTESTKALSTNDSDVETETDLDNDHPVENVRPDFDDHDNGRREESTKPKKQGLKATFEQFKTSMIRHRDLLAKHHRDTPLEDDKLIEAYFANEYVDKHGHRLHIRRTLDQFYYIGMKDTERRDIDQVVQRYALKGMKDLESLIDDKDLLDSKLIIVDQLWMWVLGEDTIITSFPQQWGHSVCSDTENKCEGVREQIELYLNKCDRKAIESVDDLAAVIINECTRVFGDFQIPKIELQFLDLFDASISDIAEDYSRIIENFRFDKEQSIGLVSQKKQVQKRSWKTLWKKEALQLPEVKSSPKQQFQKLVSLLSEIQDIQDELNIIKVVLDDQHSVLAVSEEKKKHGASEKTIASGLFSGITVDHHVNLNRKKIKHIIERTKDVYRLVYHLIDLKQKEANIESAESASQGAKTIAALTFLPLSFGSSIFALNIAEFKRDPVSGFLPLGWVSKYLFGISLAVAFVSIVLALAIGEKADLAKTMIRKIAHWGYQIFVILLLLLAIIASIALISVAIAIGIAAIAVALALFVVYYIIGIVFLILQAIWQCTPYYRKRKAKKERKRTDLEDASVLPEMKGDDKGVSAEGVAVVETMRLEEEPGRHPDSGHSNQSEEVVEQISIFPEGATRPG
ncbi:hypothetical protein N431DRAFT_457638 [Stipitochalara longipes BDJ]|nr:hypothetical protein N431DRAFT_457638 [Stipitochalara longipes BDJ]